MGVEHRDRRAQLRTLLDREEAGREPPYGRALDLGCGTGRWSVELDRRGWEVVGVDVAPKAVEAARRRAAAEGVDVEFVEGDVTALREAGVDPAFSFLFDADASTTSTMRSPGRWAAR